MLACPDGFVRAQRLQGPSWARQWLAGSAKPLPAQRPFKLARG